MEIIRNRAYARAGLLGNPSDGYNGKTISIIVRNFWAEVVMYEWDSVDIVQSKDDRARFRSIHDLAQDVRAGATGTRAMSSGQDSALEVLKADAAAAGLDADELVARIEAGGGTNLAEALKSGIDQGPRVGNRLSIVVLLTDGEENVATTATPDEIPGISARKRGVSG